LFVTITNMGLLGLMGVRSGTVGVVWQVMCERLSGVGDKSCCLCWSGTEREMRYVWGVGGSRGGVGLELGNALSDDGDGPC